jgi:hypothetical protein
MNAHRKSDETVVPRLQISGCRVYQELDYFDGHNFDFSAPSPSTGGIALARRLDLTLIFCRLPLI